jgi:hypothetical protein
MQHKTQFLLPPQCLPAALLDQKSGAVRLAPVLSEAYERLIDRHGLRELALSRTRKDSPVGGLDKCASDRHFAQQFDNSAVRTSLAITNATGDIGQVSDALLTLLSGNVICITDVPCGSGAATLGLLCTLAQLRAESIIPRLPLEVNLIAGEISEYARAYASELIAEIRPELELQSIFVNSHFLRWDVTDSISNTDLIQQMLLASAPSGRRLVVVANFSAFLGQSGKRKQAEPQLSELFRHASSNDNVAIWIEPQTASATNPNGLFSDLSRWMAERWSAFSRIVRRDLSDAPFCTCKVDYTSTLDLSRRRPIRLAIMHLSLTRRL